MTRLTLECDCILFQVDNYGQNLYKSLESIRYEAARIFIGALRHFDHYRLFAEQS